MEALFFFFFLFSASENYLSACKDVWNLKLIDRMIGTCFELNLQVKDTILALCNWKTWFWCQVWWYYGAINCVVWSCKICLQCL